MLGSWNHILYPNIDYENGGKQNNTINYAFTGIY